MATSIMGSTVNTIGGNQTNVYYNVDPELERRNITEWLSKLNFSATQSDFVDRSEKGTGLWLLESETFQNWRNGISQTLWCPGNPGAGKTILASIVVNHLQSSFTSDNVGVACIYCNYKEQTVQTAKNLIASLLKQLVQDSPAISDHIKLFYQCHQKKCTFPTLHEVTTALEAEIKTYAKVFIVVDGLDECSENDGSRLKLVRVLRSLTGPVSVMVTSRDLASIEEHFREALRIDIRATDEDVTKFVQSQLTDYPHLGGLQEIITTKIVENAKGMFLLASLHINMLKQLKNPKGVKKALNRLPSNINAIYDQAMDRIEQQPEEDKELGNRVLSWITYARRPLTVEELQHAFAVSTNMTEMDPDNLIFDSQLTSVCAGLVVVDGQHTIRLAHYTTQQYFENQRETRFPNAEADIAATCLRYLSFDVFACGYCKRHNEFESLLVDNPFLDYAARNWVHHARLHQESLKDLVMDFLRDVSKIACANQVMQLSRSWTGYSQNFPTNFSGVHIAAFFDLDVIICYQLENSANPGLPDNNRRTPLHIAAIEGSQRVVMILVARDDVNPDLKDSTDLTPLWYAAEYGHEGLVKLLVARNDVDVNSKDSKGRTPLSHAAQNGREGVVKLLLAHDNIDANSKDSKGRTPLSHAAQNGREGVVKLLLAHDNIDADSKDSKGRTPLSHAAERGLLAIVELLVAHRVDADSKDSNGRAPLSYASQGWPRPLTLLQRLNVWFKPKMSIGRIPLSSAAHKSVVKLLVACDDVDADSKDSTGRTPLSYAAQHGHKDIVELMVARDDVDTDSQDFRNQTPLSYAAEFGHKDLLAMLDRHKDSSPSVKKIHSLMDM